MPYKKIPAVYNIINVITNEKYIGSSSNVMQRFSVHKHNLRNNKHKNPKLQSAYNQYGENCFVFEIIEYISDIKQLKSREQHYIDLYNSVLNGYNVFPNSENGLDFKHSKKTKQLFSKNRIGDKNSFYKKHHSDLSKQKISLANKGKKHSLEAVNKTREGHFKPIINITTGVEYPNIKSASMFYNVSNTAISNVLRGKAKTCAGCVWKYKE